jgi:hypothetical protein
MGVGDLDWARDVLLPVIPMRAYAAAAASAAEVDAVGAGAAFGIPFDAAAVGVVVVAEGAPPNEVRCDCKGGGSEKAPLAGAEANPLVPPVNPLEPILSKPAKGSEGA